MINDCTQPTISIIIPAYNYAELLPRAVKSVIDQLSDNHELLIINDGSTDNTSDVLKQLQKEFPTKLKVYSKKNGGAASTRNYGISKSSGTYLVFLDADDKLSPNALNELNKHILSNPATQMVIGGHTSVLPNGHRKNHLPSKLPESAAQKVSDYLIKKKISIANGACAMHRKIFERGEYPEHLQSAEDLPVFSQTLAHYVCTILPEPIAIIYKHNDSLRHQYNSTKQTGLLLVDEVFLTTRLGQEFEHLKKDFYVQRCLSLFRSAYLAGDNKDAKKYYITALKKNWRIVFKGSYLRKFLRILLKG